jgi:hypothetical protein
MPNRMIVKWKFSYLDGSVEEGQALEDAQQVESEMEVLLSGLQGRRGPGIVRCLTG